MICLSHTHSGPVVHRDRASGPGGHLIAPYADRLRDTLLRSIRAALESRRPATLTWRYGKCDLATNRDLPEPGGTRYIVGYNASAPADDTLLVGRASDTSGRILATIVNYACHPTTLAWDNSLLSPDYVGAMRETVESETRAPCLFLQGASGDLAPAEQYTGDTNVPDCHGRRLGFSVLATLTAMERPESCLQFQRAVESGAVLAEFKLTEKPLPTDLIAQLRTVEFALKPLPPLAELEGAWQTCDDPVLKERLWRKRCVRKVIGDGSTVPMPLWTWRLGDSLLIGHPNEAYSRFQQHLRAAAAPRPLAVIGLVNGSTGYLPPSELFDNESIYTVWQTPFQRGSLERLIAAAREALLSLSPPGRGRTIRGGERWSSRR